jgi:F-type H+-transporting ATPase subunit epsilon
MASFHFELVSPARLLFDGSVDSVVVPGSDGDMTIMANHAALMTSLRPGIVVVNSGSGVQRLFVRGGFADVNAAGLTILAEQATAVEDLDADTIAKELRNAEEDVQDAKSDASRQAAQQRLDRLKEVVAALRN